MFNVWKKFHSIYFLNQFTDTVLSLHLYSNMETSPHIRNTLSEYYSTNNDIFNKADNNEMQLRDIGNEIIRSNNQSNLLPSLCPVSTSIQALFYHIVSRLNVLFFNKRIPFLYIVKLNPKNTDDSHITPFKSQTFEQLQNYRYRNLKPMQYSKHTFVFSTRCICLVF